MMAFRIFRHSVVLVFSQLGAALRVSGLLYLVLVIVMRLGLFLTVSGTTAEAPPQFSWPFVLVVLVAGLFCVWIAVAWHRHVLLDEPAAKLVPAFRPERLLAYFGRAFQVALILIPVTIAILLATFALSTAFPAAAWVIALVPLIVLIIFSLIFYRLGPMLPAAAIGKSIGVGAAWASTRGAWGTLLVISLVALISAVVIDLPAILLSQSAPGAIFGLVWFIVTGWVKLIVGVSLLTTLYGVYVEKRAIA